MTHEGDGSWPRFVICDWSSLKYWCEKEAGRPLTPWLSQNPPPPHLRGDLVSLEGRTCCTARQTIFRMTGFTFDRGLVKTNWQNKGQQINDPCSHPSPLDLDSVPDFWVPHLQLDSSLLSKPAHARTHARTCTRTHAHPYPLIMWTIHFV